jgi:primosomal protein N' (replication factor Y) (superfamily II helicase)
MNYYLVILQAKQRGINDGLTYESTEEYSPGDLVEVPLRTANIPAIIIEVTTKPEYETKAVHTLIASQVLLPEHIATAKFMSEYYCASLRSTISTFLPGNNWRQYALQPHVLLHDNYVGKVTAVQKKIIAIKDQLPLSILALRQVAGITSASIEKLLDQGFLIPTKTSRTNTVQKILIPTLTDQQEDVAKKLNDTRKPQYVFGVTGSGKTEVYSSVIATALKNDKQALVLLPEIFVTEHSKERYCRYFPSANIVLWHSKMTTNERKSNWHAIRSGDANIVIGSRSAVTMPFCKLGCIILDEEHEWTYKQDTTPRYHARTMAEYIAKKWQIPCVFGSATPSLEAWHNMQNTIYTKHVLPNRYGTAGLPEVRVIDLNATYTSAFYPFSDDVITAIKATLQRKEKVVLFLNKRGIASCLLCTHCKRRVISAVTQLPLSVHRMRSGEMRLYDQFTQQYYALPQRCPHCQGEELRTVGTGTHGIEELCTTLFPNTPLWRIDSDTLKASGSIELMLNTITTSGSGIILGTQAVVKGLDLPDVTLSVVLIADIGLSLPHFRASERVFQLLMQLSGRSGRHRPGQVYVQTFRPEAIEISAVKEHNAELFYTQEYALRKAMNYPPFVPMIRILFRGNTAQHDAKAYAETTKEYIQHNLLECTVLTSATFFGGGTVWQCLVKGDNARFVIEQCVPHGGFIDVDPLETL